jgi:hypothetical protein
MSNLLKDPEKLKAGIEAMVEAERAGMRGDPKQEAKVWLEKLSETDQERRGYLRLAAKGHMADEELDEALAELEDARQTAENELRALRGPQEGILDQLERDKDALLAFYARMVPEELDRLDGAERHQVYKMLRLKVVIHPDASLEVTGVLRNCFAHENQDERLVGAQQPARRRRHPDVEAVQIHATSLA